VEPLEPDDDLLESLYVTNKVAKQLADEATEAYDRGDATRSNVCSARKDALYRTKTTVLNRIVAHDPSLVTGEYHAINGDVWLLVTVNGWEFHQPPYAFGSDLTDRIEITNSPDEPADVPYVREAGVERSNRSLEEALVALADRGVNANDSLARSTVQGNATRSSTFGGRICGKVVTGSALVGYTLRRLRLNPYEVCVCTVYRCVGDAMSDTGSG